MPREIAINKEEVVQLLINYFYKLLNNYMK
jgi:hypothetical protein